VEQVPEPPQRRRAYGARQRNDNARGGAYLLRGAACAPACPDLLVESGFRVWTEVKGIYGAFPDSMPAAARRGVANGADRRMRNEAVIEGMGSMVSLHADKTRGRLGFDQYSAEAIFHYNFPHLSHPSARAIIVERSAHGPLRQGQGRQPQAVALHATREHATGIFNPVVLSTRRATLAGSFIRFSCRTNASLR
jgi:hypothetical protein